MTFTSPRLVLFISQNHSSGRRRAMHVKSARRQKAERKQRECDGEAEDRRALDQRERPEMTRVFNYFPARRNARGRREEGGGDAAETRVSASPARDVRCRGNLHFWPIFEPFPPPSARSTVTHLPPLAFVPLPPSCLPLRLSAHKTPNSRRLVSMLVACTCCRFESGAALIGAIAWRQKDTKRWDKISIPSWFTRMYLLFLFFPLNCICDRIVRPRAPRPLSHGVFFVHTLGKYEY